MDYEPLSIPHVIIHPTKIITYNERINKRSGGKEKLFSHFDKSGQPVYSSFLTSSRKAEGTVSVNAKRKMTKAIEYLLTVAVPKTHVEKLSGKTVRFKVAFVTLTLPSKQQHSDKELINTCFNQFLVECRKYHNVKNYVWRAEKQKNGNLHFHLVVDTFIPWWLMRNRWNRIINKLGYVDRFKEKHGHANPNSTDIHSTKHVKNVAAYLTKYITKDEKAKTNNNGTKDNQSLPDSKDNEDFSKQTGRIWGCNRELSQAKGLNLELDWEISDELERIVKRAHPHIYKADYFQVFYLNYKSLLSDESNLLFQMFSDYLIQQFGFHEQLKLAC